MKPNLNKNLIGTISALILANTNASAETSQAIGIDYVHGEGGVNGLRMVYHPYASNNNRTISIKDYVKDVELNYEFSLNLWQFDKKNNYENNLAIAFSPVFSKQFSTIYGKPLKWEAGIGISLVQNTVFAGKDIGSHYQFEDRIGIKLVLDRDSKKSISIRYIHYSNAGLNEKNPGLDFLNISYIVKF